MGSVLKNAVIRAVNLSCFVAHACTKFSLEPSVLYPREGKVAELGEPVKIRGSGQCGRCENVLKRESSQIF